MFKREEWNKRTANQELISKITESLRGVNQSMMVNFHSVRNLYIIKRMFWNF